MKNKFFLLLCSLIWINPIWADDNNWTYNPYDFQYDMTVYLNISIDGGNALDDFSDYSIAAFCGNECRGIAEVKTANSIHYGYLRIRSNSESGEQIVFKVYDAVNNNTLRCNDSIVFESLKVIGKPSDMWTLSAQNKYKLEYVVEDEVYKTDSIYFGDEVIAIEAPELEGHTFDYWDGVPETMPANDVVVKAVYIINVYETPSLDFDDPYLTITCATENATVHYTLDGTDPTGNSIIYTAPIEITSPCVVKAIAQHPSYLDSEVGSYKVERCDSARMSYDGDLIVLSTAEEGGTIYYTIDGSIPDKNSTLYTTPLLLAKDCTLKTVVFKDKMLRSVVSSYNIVGAKVATPIFEYDGSSILKISTTTPTATILYRIEGTDMFVQYSNPLALTDNRPVYAYGRAEGYSDSDTVSYTPTNFTCEMVSIEFHEPWLAMGCDMDDVIIHYTLDGTVPTIDSPIFSSDVSIDEPCVVTAVAMKDYWNNSDVTKYEIKRCTAPTFEYDGESELTVSSDMPEASIYYMIEGIGETYNSYESALKLFDNRSVYAYAKADGWLRSENSSFTPDNFYCDPIHIEFLGSEIVAYSNTEGVVISLMVNSLNVGEEYDYISVSVDDLMQIAYGAEDIGPLFVEAVASKEYLHSVKDSCDVPSYSRWFVEEGKNVLNAYSFIAGHIYEGIFWNINDVVDNLKIFGEIDNRDINDITNVDVIHLDLSDSYMSQIPDNAFFGMDNLITVVFPNKLPQNTFTVGSNIFEGSMAIAAIQWNADIKMPTAITENIHNPNLLLYVSSSVYAPDNVQNVIAGGYADQIILSTVTDESSFGNFYCMEAFTAGRISYEHEYGMMTDIDNASGWETLSLPFDVKTIWHVDKHTEIASFANLREQGETTFGKNSKVKPFWLYSLGTTNWEEATEIRAYTPYIISMPNNPNYLNSLNLNGRVSFRAENAVVEKNTANIVEGNGVSFVPAMMKVGKAQNVFAINLYDNASATAGSVFWNDYRDVCPFEAYIETDTESTGPASIVVKGFNPSDGTTGIVDAEQTEDVCDAIYNLSGQRVANPGRGIYIKGGKKVAY